MAFYPLTAETDNDALRILLIEDSESDRDLVRRYLMIMWPHRKELQLEFASDAPEALHMIRTHDYSLLLLDWRLPGMDGGHVLRALERNGQRIPVVILTGLDRSELPKNLETTGAVYLNKDNLNIRCLHEAIASALSNVLSQDTPSATLPAQPLNQH
jgi:CheY-like chemotaxis protein